MMVKQNVAQHEQYLKHLEASLKEICDKHKQIKDLVNESWTMTMEQFVVADNLRTIRLAFEKAEGQ
jgi:DNA topoisomerase IA